MSFLNPDQICSKIFLELRGHRVLATPLFADRPSLTDGYPYILRCVQVPLPPFFVSLCML